jgi:hypothetical protein
MFVVLMILVIGFAFVLQLAGNHLGNEMGPTLETLEAASSP